MFFSVTLPVRLLPFVYWRYNINSLLTIGGWWFFFWPAKIHCYFTNTLQPIRFRGYTWRTCKVFKFSWNVVLNSLFCRSKGVFSSTVSFIFTFLSESVTEGFLAFCWSGIHIVWIRTIFWRTIIFWDTSISVVWTIRKYLYKILNSSLKLWQCIIFENLMFFSRVGTKI